MLASAAVVLEGKELGSATRYVGCYLFQPPCRVRFPLCAQAHSGEPGSWKEKGGNKRGQGWVKPGTWSESSPAKAVFEEVLLRCLWAPHPLPILNSCSEQSGCAPDAPVSLRCRSGCSERPGQLFVSFQEETNTATPRKSPDPAAPAGGRDARRARLPRRQPEAGQRVNSN